MLFPTLLLAFATTLPAGTIPGWQDSVGIASGRGEKGPWQQNASRYDYVDDGTVAFAPGRGHYLAWAGQKSHDVWFRSVANDGSLGVPLNVARSPATFLFGRSATAAPAPPRRSTCRARATATARDD